MAHEEPEKEKRDVTSHVETKQSTTKKEQTGAGRRENAKSEKKEQESVYTAEELANNAKTIFSTRKECVVAALKAVDVKKCTISEAREIVKSFLSKEVK